MKSKEIIDRIVNHREPPRFGFDFNDQNFNDFHYVPERAFLDEPDNPYGAWGRHAPLLEQTHFSGEVFRDRYGNIYGRLNGKTKGECISPALKTWDDFEAYRTPKLDRSIREKLKAMNLKEHDRYVMCSGASIFSSLRDARLMSNALMDTVLEPERVKAFLSRLADYECEAIDIIAGCGIDAMMIGDDWGVQDRTFISPEVFAELFKPAYKRIADALHNAGMKCFMHSCGYIYGFINHLIEAGIDVFQFDQPDVYPAEVLAKDFGSRVSFHSPVDIQKVLPTGDEELIRRRAREMTEVFRALCGGSFIFKDYGAYQDIGVDPRWARWAQDEIVQNSAI